MVFCPCTFSHLCKIAVKLFSADNIILFYSCIDKFSVRRKYFCPFHSIQHEIFFRLKYSQEIITQDSSALHRRADNRIFFIYTHRMAFLCQKICGIVSGRTSAYDINFHSGNESFQLYITSLLLINNYK